LDDRQELRFHSDPGHTAQEIVTVRLAAWKMIQVIEYRNENALMDVNDHHQKDHEDIPML
jgi:hypothetical protein